MPKNEWTLRRTKHFMDAWQAREFTSTQLALYKKRLPDSISFDHLIEENTEGYYTMPAKAYVELAKLLIRYGHEIFLEEYENFIAEKYDYRRGEMNFIDGFLEYTKEAESPTSFLRWAAITALAATLRDNTWWYVGTGTRIYPNIYTILVARSGACRKGYPLQQVNKLLKMIDNTKRIDGNVTIQSAVKILAETITREVKGPGGYMLDGGSAILYTEELAGFLVEDPATIPVLTDLYDYKEEYPVHRVAAGTFTVKSCCLTMLAASNEPFLKEVYSKRAQYGGLLGRTFLIMEQKRRGKNSRMFVKTEEEDAKRFLVLKDHLIRVAQLKKGPAHIADETKKLFDDFYMGIEDDESSQTGVKERLGTNVQKIAMCLAAADKDLGNTLYVLPKHVEEAIDLCQGLIRNYDYFMMGSGVSNNSKIAPLVLRDLMEAPNFCIPKSRIVRKYMNEVDMNQFKQVEETLIEGGYIEVKTGPRSNELHYWLTKKVIEELNKKGEGK